MPLLEVACPGCQAPLKAPDTMAGKKARCKRCNTSFRLPGGATADSVGDSQMLSVVDPPPAPAPAPAARRPSPARKPAPVEDDEDIPSAAPVDDDEPLAAVVADEEPAPAAGGDPFSFDATPAAPAAKKKPRPARDEDDEPAPAAPAASGDPFSFDGSAEPAAKSGSKSGIRKKPPARRDDDADEDDRPAAGKKKPAGGGGGLIKVAVAAAVFALVAGGVVAGVIVFLNNKPGEQAKNEKKKDEKVEPPPVEPTPTPAGKTDPTPPPKDKEGGKGTKGTTGGTPPKVAKGKGGGMLTLPAGKVFAFPVKPAAPKAVTEPSNNPPPVELAFAEVRRFFPPAKADADIGVAWRSHAGFQGAGEKITLSLFSPNTGKEVAKVETEGDGSTEPACDLSVDGGTFAAGNRLTGKVTVWDVRKKVKKLDAFDPYKDKPEHKAAKLAAVYLTEPPDRLVTVTTAGAVHVWELGTKAMAGEYVPPKAAPNKVSPGRGVASTPNRQGVVVAVGGTVYRVDTAGTVSGNQAADLGGDVGRSLALAVSPGGKVLYAFETDADGKKEKAVMMLTEDTRSPAFRWPADGGEPVSAGWAGDNVAALGTSQGAAVWFDAETGFNPIAVARTPEDKAAHAVGDSHWTLLPSAGNPKLCLVIELALPPQGVGDPLTPAARRPTASLVLDGKGLSQDTPKAAP